MIIIHLIEEWNLGYAMPIVCLRKNLLIKSEGSNKVEDEFYLWFHVTFVSCLFKDSWSTDARDIAIKKLKSMQNVYSERSSFEFFRTRAKDITNFIENLYSDESYF
jgi:hypothetical protein